MSLDIVQANASFLGLPSMLQCLQISHMVCTKRSEPVLTISHINHPSSMSIELFIKLTMLIIIHNSSSSFKGSAQKTNNSKTSFNNISNKITCQTQKLCLD